LWFFISYLLSDWRLKTSLSGWTLLADAGPSKEDRVHSLEVSEFDCLTADGV